MGLLNDFYISFFQDGCPYFLPLSAAPSGNQTTLDAMVNQNLYLLDMAGGPVGWVYVTNGTLTWSYDASTKILTLNVTHLSPARIVVYWRRRLHILRGILFLCFQFMLGFSKLFEI